MKSKADLLAEHAAAIEGDEGSTLLGCQTFGEGIDLPGKLCTTVVITNLPFSVPTDPVAATFGEWLESRGRRPVDEVSVPDATRVLVQYAGRLIRHEEDQGRVVILDSRLISKSYGKRILKALPPFRRDIAI